MAPMEAAMISAFVSNGLSSANVQLHPVCFSGQEDAALKKIIRINKTHLYLSNHIKIL